MYFNNRLNKLWPNIRLANNALSNWAQGFKCGDNEKSIKSATNFIVFIYAYSICQFCAIDSRSIHARHDKALYLQANLFFSHEIVNKGKKTPL